MEKKNWKKRVGLILIVLGVLIFAAEVVSDHAFSDFLGGLFCGDRYMVVEDGQFGDGVCGFNADIQTVMAGFLMVPFGLVFLFLGRKKEKDK